MNCPEMTPAEGGCDRCGTPLTGRKRRWCSSRCSIWWLVNHRYTNARREAKRKAYVRGKGWRCARCGNITRKPEVNHIVPCLGAHAKLGCFHHQDNLEVLDRDCHLAETRRQRAAGELVKA